MKYTPNLVNFPCIHGDKPTVWMWYEISGDGKIKWCGMVIDGSAVVKWCITS